MSHRENKWMEEEANYFAMCLLMPEELVRREAANLTFDLSSDDALKYLSQLFGVSMTAMAMRLSQLKIYG